MRRLSGCKQVCLCDSCCSWCLLGAVAPELVRLATAFGEKYEKKCSRLNTEYDALRQGSRRFAVPLATPPQMSFKMFLIWGLGVFLEMCTPFFVSLQ